MMTLREIISECIGELPVDLSSLDQKINGYVGRSGDLLLLGRPQNPEES